MCRTSGDRVLDEQGLVDGNLREEAKSSLKPEKVLGSLGPWVLGSLGLWALIKRCSSAALDLYLPIVPMLYPVGSDRVRPYAPGKPLLGNQSTIKLS